MAKAQKNAAVAEEKPVAAAKPAKAAPAKAVKAKAEPAAPAAKPAKVKAAPKVEVTPISNADAVEGDQDDDNAPDTGTIVGRPVIASAMRAHLQTLGFGMSEKVALAAAVAYEHAVTAQMAEHATVVLPGFGKFKTSLRAARESRNPKTGAQVHVAAAYAVTFKPGKALKDSANNRTASAE